jgi:hypothetical protein
MVKRFIKIISSILLLIIIFHSQNVYAKSTSSLDTENLGSLDISGSAEYAHKGVSFDNLSSRSIALDSNGYPWIVYGSGGLILTRWDGSAWQTETIDSNVGTGEWAAIAIDTTTDTAHISYEDSANTDLKYTTGTPGSWSTSTIATVGGEYTSIALDTSGYPHIIFMPTGGYLKYITNASGSWDDTTITSAKTGTGRFSSIYIDSSDNIHISYYKYAGSGVLDLMYSTTTVGSTSFTDETIDGTGSRGVGQYSSLIVDTSNIIHVVYYDQTNYILKYSYKTVGGSSWSSPQTIDSIAAVGLHVSLDFNSSNQLFASYYDNDNQTLKFAYYSGSSWSYETLDSDSNVGTMTAIAVDKSSSKVNISYVDESNGALKYISRNSSSSSFNDPETLTTRQEVGEYSSLAIDASGNAYIVYYDSTNKNLLFATNRSGDWVLETIDSEDDIGEYAGIDIDDSNQLHVVYYDSTNTNLKYATKAASSGSSAWTTATLDDGQAGKYASIVVDYANTIHVFYYDSGEEKIMHQYNSGSSWSKETVGSPSVDSGLYYTKAAVSPDNKLYLGYCKCTLVASEVPYYATNDTDDGSWELSSVYNTTSGDYSSPSIAIDSEGYAHFSLFGLANINYSTNRTDGDYDELYRFINTTTEEGDYSHIQVDSSDQVYISYYDSSNGDLEIITRTSKVDEDSNGNWVVGIIDSDGDVGQYASMKIYETDSGNTFMIAYYDTSNKALKFISTELDSDSDGYYSSNDCDDNDSSTYPGATEVCGDSTDNDCDGDIDEESATPHVTWYADNDDDDYGNSSSTKSACATPAGYTSDNEDCDDSDSSINPDSTEVCGDSTDNDCDDNIDEQCTANLDVDDDGDGYTENEGDCDDTSSDRSPGESEVCDNVDNDCDNLIDEDDDDVVGASIYYPDFDGDGYGDFTDPTVLCDSDVASSYTANDEDCNDSDSRISPDATEVCDGTDNDCDGSDDVNASDTSTWYLDADSDDYGNSDYSYSYCTQPSYYVEASTDCNDDNSAINPGLTESCSDGIDNDCDGVVDESDCENDVFTPEASRWSGGSSGGGCSLYTGPKLKK